MPNPGFLNKKPAGQICKIETNKCASVSQKKVRAFFAFPVALMTEEKTKRVRFFFTHFRHATCFTKLLVLMVEWENCITKVRLFLNTAIMK